MKQVTRRGFIGGVAAAGAAVAGSAALAGCNSGSQSQGSGSADEKIDVTVGYWGGTCEAPIFVAKEKGFFEEEGLNPNVILLDSGGSNNSDAMMASGELDCYELTPDKFKPMEQGLDLKIIDSLHCGCIQGATLKNSGIKTVADLEGKKVAASVGSIAQIMIASEMVQQGKDPDKVKWLTYKNPMMEAALDKGEIDAFACYDPFTDVAVANGKHRFFSWTYDDETKDILCCFVGCNGQTIEKKPEVAGKLCRAFKKANEFLEANPEEAAQIIIDGGYVAVDTDSGFTKEIMVKEITDYTWKSGDKQILDDSFKYIWECIWRAGALEDQKFDTIEQLDEYAMNTLYAQEVVFSA